jgi:hypothetical protein
MASTKVVTVVEDDVTLTAGAGDDTSTGVNLTDGYGGKAFVKLTNGATGPTVAAQVQLQESADNSNWYDLGGPLVGSTGNNEVVSWPVPIDMGTLYIRSVSGSNTGQDVTVRIEVSEVTGI